MKTETILSRALLSLMLLAGITVAMPSYAQSQGVAECAWPTCAAGGTADPIVPADGQQNITGDLNASGTIIGTALAITPNDTLNAATFSANEGGGSNFTCADDGVDDTFSIIDMDDTDGVNNWVGCDGTTRAGPIGNIEYIQIFFADNAFTSSANIGHHCPLVNSEPSLVDEAVAFTGNRCYAPIGVAFRFHWIGLVLSNNLTDNEDECRLSITYATARDDDYTGQVPNNIIGERATPATPAWIYALPATNDTSQLEGYSPPIVLLDNTQEVVGWWTVHVGANPSGTCDRLNSINVTVAYEIIELNP